MKTVGNEHTLEWPYHAAKNEKTALRRGRTDLEENGACNHTVDEHENGGEMKAM